MAGRPIERYVTQQILEHGGYEALVERIRQGESVAMIARTLFKPDGQAIHRTTLSHMLHARDDRSAQVAAAMVEWRRRPRGERLATRKRLRVTASLRAMRALLGMREPPAPFILPAASRRRTILRTEETPFASPLNELASGAAPITTPPASKPLVGTPPGPAMVIPTSIPELPPNGKASNGTSIGLGAIHAAGGTVCTSSRNTCAAPSGIRSSILLSPHGCVDWYSPERTGRAVA